MQRDPSLICNDECNLCGLFKECSDRKYDLGADEINQEEEL